MDNVFLDIGLILIIATCAGLIAKRFNQPFIPSYILAGFVTIPIVFLIEKTLSYYSYIPMFSSFGPGQIALFNFARDSSVINVISEVAITFLLFIVGLEISIKKIKEVSHIAIWGGIAQIVLTFAFVFLVASFLGYNLIVAMLIGIGIAFSSTMVVLKVFSDKGEIDTLHGKIAIGLLLIQDIVAIFALVMIKSSSFSINQIWKSVIIGIFLVIFAILMSKKVIPRVFKFAATSGELLFLTSISFCFFFSLLFGISGFSMSIGAFIAGITIANLPYSFEIIGKVKSLRDFFATIFFVILGMQIEISHLSSIIPQILLFSFIIIIIKPAIVFFIITLFGYKTRTSLSTALSLAQISEFSIILISLGVLESGLKEQYPNLLTIIIILAAISMAVSNYFIKYDAKIYSLLKNKLERFEKFSLVKNNLDPMVQDDEYDAVLCGYDRTGHHIYDMIKKVHKKAIVIDFNPEIIKNLMNDNVPCIYGDIGNTDVLQKINFSKTKLVVSTIPDMESSLHLLKWIKKQNPNTTVFLTSYNLESALTLYKEGADYVILPHFLGGYHAALIIEETTNDIDALLKKRLSHIKELHKRRSLGHGIDDIHPKKHNNI